MSTALKTQDSNVAAIATPATLLQMAVEQNADIDKLEKLMNLQDRWMASQNRQEFFEAFTKFQSRVPALTKSKQGHNYKYAPLSDIAEQIKSTMFECGLSYRFEQKQYENGSIEITCIVSHVSGHCERNTMVSVADTSGSKNGIQAIGSAVSYLQRYTLIGALGIATADEDMDGRLALSGGDFIGDEQLAELEALLGSVDANRDKFLAHFKIKEIRDLPASRYASAMAMLRTKASKGAK